MKRKDIIKKLVKEGFLVKTLVGLGDKQLNTLANRILGEQYNADEVNPVQIPKTDTTAINQAKQQKKQFVAYEGDMTEDKDSDAKEESIAIKRIKHKIEHCKDKKKIESYKSLLKRMEDKKVKSSGKEIDEQFMDDDSDLKAMRGWMPHDPRYDNFNTTVTVDEPFTINFTDSGEYAKLMLILQKYRIPFRETEDGEVEQNPIGAEIREEDKPKFKSKTEWLKSKGIIKDDDDSDDKKEDTKESIAPANQPVGLSEWVNNMVGKNVHPFTSKNEILNLINKNLSEQETMEPPVRQDDPPGLGDKPKLPEFLSYDNINNAGSPAPAEPTIKPKTRPGNPEIRPKKDNPYQPGPGINPAPKAEKKQ